jgi:hypothetical protein
MISCMRLAPLAKAFVFAAIGFSLARALLVHDGVGVVEWFVGLLVVGTLGAGAVHFGYESLRRTSAHRPGSS